MQRRLGSIIGGLIALGVAYLGLWLFTPDPLDSVEVPAWVDHSPPAIEVLLSGVGGAPLRWAPGDKGTARFEVVSVETARMTLGGESLLVTSGTTAIQVHGTVTPQAGGNAQWAWRVRSAESRGASASGPLAVGEPAALVRELTGRRGETLFDERGFVVERSATGGKLKTPGGVGAAAAVDSLLGDAVMHFPDGPIGDGGSWAVHRDRSQAGLRFTTRERWDVRDRERGLQLVGHITGAATPGALEGGPFVGRVQRGTVTGEARVRLAPDRDFVIDGAASSAFEVVAQLSWMGVPSDVTWSGTTDVTWRRLD